MVLGRGLDEMQGMWFREQEHRAVFKMVPFMEKRSRIDQNDAELILCRVKLESEPHNIKLQCFWFEGASLGKLQVLCQLIPSLTF